MPKIELQQISTRAPKGTDEKEIEKLTREMAGRISELQEALRAEAKQSLLVVFQGMDGSGKDGSTKAAFGACSPIGVTAVGYKKPTPDEFAHDFLWRVHRHAPAKGEIAIFIRSHYEDVLIQRVHQWIDEDRVKARFAAINAFEETLRADNRTTVLKFFLHISPEKQEEKLRERIEKLEDNWKHNDGDWEERKHWDAYMKAYEDVFEACPGWQVVPADQRWYRNYCVTKAVLEALEKMNPKYPKLDLSQVKAPWKK